MSTSPPPDRLAQLRKSNALNGVDFVEVDATQTRLVVHFVNGVELSTFTPNVTITGGDVIPTVQVEPFDKDDWGLDADGRRFLVLHTAAPGDFSSYTLAIDDPKLDRFFRRAAFSFKANCESRLDCKVPPVPCPPDEDVSAAIDYLAKDFASFRQALLDFSARRYPRWVERSEADFGMMLLEAMAAVADDLSYTQDRIAAEAYLDTATERRSLVRHARLVDYEPRPATAARVWLQLTVTGPSPVAVPAGMPVFARAPDGRRIEFETGTGLSDTAVYPADPRWNADANAGAGLVPHIWDRSETCLAAGAQEMWLVGHDLGLTRDLWLLIDTAPEVPGEPPIRELVRLSEPPQETKDELLGADLTRIAWGKEHALRRHHDLLGKTRVSGNLLPGTQGRRRTDFFVTAIQDTAAGVPRAIVRAGANGTDQFLFTLTEAPLAWLAQTRGELRPEIQVTQRNPTRRFEWLRSMLAASEVQRAYTVDPVRYRSVGAELPGARRFFEYDGDRGDTIVFGDGTFGVLPEEDALFEVTYRVGGGATGNVAADTITGIEPGSPLAALASAVVNPFPAAGGNDQETAEDVRRDAPESFKENLRAVRKEDYEAVAASRPWVQRAGTQFRYTGSWHTIFTAADTLDTDGAAAGIPSRAQLSELVQLLNQRRMAGYESYVLEPRFVSLDLDIEVCARADAFRGHVEDALLRALGSRPVPGGAPGFFHVDRFTFGQPLHRSALEAAIMAVPGIDGVRFIKYRRRGRQDWSDAAWDLIPVGPDEILRVDGDPNRPERGSVRIHVEGGK